MQSHQAGARFGPESLPRLRRILIAAYVLIAFADAGAKALAADPAVNAALARIVHPSRANDVHEAAKPSGNFEIFRLATRHLFSRQNMYALYPDEISDRFKYSPSFALLFTPFAYVYWPLALFCWSLLNALALFYAVGRILPLRQALLAQLFLLFEILRAMQNAQSNALVAALIVLAWVALERRKAWAAAGAVALGTCVKIFPLAALSFALPRRLVTKTVAAAAAVGAALVVLPLVVTPPATLLQQYKWWREVESSDSHQRWYSVMELLHRWLGTTWTNWPVQLGGTLALLAPLALRRERWDEERFRFLYLCSVLMYVVLFNHQAERASYVIAFTGATLWFASEPAATWRTLLYGLAMVTLPLMSTLIPIPGGWMRTQTVTLYRLAPPMLAIWLVIQFQLVRRRSQD